ncbi:hypothetical protein LWF01_13855 [Saxibacter everestensis]|uniref:LPXTG-motif cell wall anchor domain-containing protein n=1 Tax=Saxibacter everestensis TaxID=2909229 RepID=A0ABY8QS77_9MICO|nr:hypothetical protein LWF01_13855 [Brevibacteriaceae bacterium ZFBP1038]
MKSLIHSLRRVAAVTAGALITSIALTGFAGLAAADTPDDIVGHGRWHNSGSDRTWYGSYRTIAEDKPWAWCLDAGLATPYRAAFKNQKPTNIKAPELAYMLARSEADTTTANHVALSAQVKLSKALPHRHSIRVVEPREANSGWGDAQKIFDRLSREAKAYAGPYSVRTSVAKDTDTTGTTSFSLRSASDQPMAGYDYAVDIDGPAELLVAAPAPAALTGKTTESKTTIPLRFTGSGKVTVTVTVRGLPADHVQLYKPKSKHAKKIQNVVTSAASTKAKGSAGLKVVLPSTPRVTTEISAKRPEPGAPVSDKFTVSGLTGRQKVDVVHTLWSSPVKPKESTSPAPEAKQLGSVTSQGVGNGTHNSPEITVPDDFAGWLYWTERIKQTSTTKEWNGRHGLSDETGFVAWRPQISTKASSSAAEPPATVSDQGRIVGARPGSTLTVTTTAYGPLEREPEPSDLAPEHTAILKSWKQEVQIGDDGTGNYNTPELTIDKPGYITFVASIAADDVHKAWTSQFGQPEETVQLEAPPEGGAQPEKESPPDKQTKPESPQPQKSPQARPELPKTGPAGAWILVGLAIAVLGVGVLAVGFSSSRRAE